MYALNGYDLDNNTLGAYLLFDSQPYAGINRISNSFQAGARDGRIAVPWQNDAPVIALVARMPATSLESFLALLNEQTLILSRTDVADRSTSVELTSVTVENLATYTSWVDVRFTLQFNDVYWRSTTVLTSSPVAVASNDFTAAQFFNDISAPIRDAVIRVKGSVTGLKVWGASTYTWFEYQPNVPATSYFRFESATGRAFITTTDSWGGGTEVTGLVKNGPGPYFFELAPRLSLGSPAGRVADFMVLTLAASGTPTVEVRGRNAFLV